MKEYVDGYKDGKADQVKEIIDWCYKNNTIPLKNNPNIHLAITDGGWINVLELQKYLKEKQTQRQKE